METRSEDFVRHLGVASTHAYLLFFTNRGRLHWLKVHALPQLGRAAKGKAIVNALQLGEGEVVQTMLPVRSFDEVGADECVVLCTRKGVVKKTSLSAYSNPRRGGIIAVGLTEGDELIAAERSKGDSSILVASQSGKAILFEEGDIRPMGRTAVGVRGIALGQGDAVVGMKVLAPGATILTLTANGYGKRTRLEDYRVQRRGGQGIINIKATPRNGNVVGVAQVGDGDHVMLITDGGKMLRCPVSGISVMGRATQGVRVMKLGSQERLVALARLAEGDAATADATDTDTDTTDTDTTDTTTDTSDTDITTDTDSADGTGTDTGDDSATEE
jgi:DNA gyrase subunit A